MAINKEFAKEWQEFYKGYDAHGKAVHNMLLFRLCKAVEALKAEIVEVEMAGAEVLFNAATDSKRFHE